MELFQIRWNCGGLEYRQRVGIHGHAFDHIQKIVVTTEWGPWKKVEGVTGDGSDERRWPG